MIQLLAFVLLCRYELCALAFRVQALLLKFDRFTTFMEVQIAHASILAVLVIVHKTLADLGYLRPMIWGKNSTPYPFSK